LQYFHFIICHTFSSIAKLTGSDAKVDDSEQILNAFLGKSDKGRTDLILESGQKTALRSGDWVLIPPYKGNPINKQVNIELGISSEYQLYNLKEDRGQQNNLAATNKSKLTEMIAKYKKQRGEVNGEIKELELK